MLPAPAEHPPATPDRPRVAPGMYPARACRPRRDRDPQPPATPDRSRTAGSSPSSPSSRAARRAGLTDLDLAVHRAIASYDFDSTGVAHPSQERIALDLRVRRETVNRAVRRLVRAGWLEVE